MKKKYLIYVFSSLFLLSCLVGCQDQADRVTKNKESIQAVEKSITKDVTDQLKVEIKEIQNYDREQKKIPVTQSKLDLEAVKKAVFPEDQSAARAEIIDDGVERLTTAKGLEVIYDGEFLSGWRKEWNRYEDFLGLQNIAELGVEMPVDGELDFIAKAEVKKKVLNLVKELGLNFEPSGIKIESYPKEYLAKLLDKLNGSPQYNEFIKPETLAQDRSLLEDMYYIEVGFKEQGLAIDETGFTLLDDTDIAGMQLRLYLTKQGFQSIEADSLLDKGKEKTVTIGSVQDGIDAIANKYKNIVTDEKLKITGVRLEYAILPGGLKGERYLTPVFKFTVQSSVAMESSEGKKQNTAVTDMFSVNAETGRIVE